MAFGMGHGHEAYIGGVVAPLAMRLEGLLGDGPQQAAQVTELHHHHHHCVLPLHTIQCQAYTTAMHLSKVMPLSTAMHLCAVARISTILHLCTIMHLCAKKHLYAIMQVCTV